MRVLMLSKALIVGAYQSKAEALARLGVDLMVLVPPSWRDRRGDRQLERRFTDGYTLRSIPVRLNGQFHLHYYPTLWRELKRFKPDIVHIDEEPYNLASWLAARAAGQQAARITFFAWQNIYKRYPFPFGWFEQQLFSRTPCAIVGNRDAGDILRRKGYSGRIEVIPQFGVDPKLFYAKPLKSQLDPSLKIGYAGGLLPEKGLDLLIRACAELNGSWSLRIVGSGESERALQGLIKDLDLHEQVCIDGIIPSVEMPAFYKDLDLFVLPSRTRPNWKEQFGRVLIEAMASGVVVIGSDSGEIPHVIGPAGLIFPEDNRAALTAQIQRLLDWPEERRRLVALGQARVTEHYTMEKIAAATLAVYQSILDS